MTTLKGGSQVFDLTPGEVLTVSAIGDGSLAHVSVESATGTPPTITGSPVTAGNSATFGPFTVQCSIKVYAVGRASIARGDGSPASVSGAGNITKRQWLTKSAPHGRLTTAATGGTDRTDHTQTVLETPAGLVRIGILNNVAVALTGVKVAFCCATTLGADNSAASIDPTLNGGTWQATLFAGAATGTIAAGSATHTVDNPTVTWTDWMSCQGLDSTDPSGLPVLHVRVEVPGAANANVPVYNWTDTSGWETPANVANRPWRTRTQAVLGVTTKAAFTSTVFNGQTIPILIQYIPRDNVAGYTFCTIGDSTTEGTGATVRNYGWAQRGQAVASTPSKPVELCCLAINGASSSRFYDRVQSLIPQIQPEVCAIQIYTVNSASVPMTASDIAGMRYNLQLCRTIFGQNDTLAIWLSGLPTNPAAKNFQSSDSLRVAYNAQFMGRASSRSGYLDLAVPFSGVTDGNGQVNVAAGLTTDNTHPNEAGHAALGVPCATLMQTLLLRA